MSVLRAFLLWFVGRGPELEKDGLGTLIHKYLEVNGHE